MTKQTFKKGFETGKETTTRSFPILGITFLIFLTLKLAGIGTVATWSWLWVTAPLWGPFALFLAFVGFIICFVILGAIFAYTVAGVSYLANKVKK